MRGYGINRGAATYEKLAVDDYLPSECPALIVAMWVQAVRDALRLRRYGMYDGHDYKSALNTARAMEWGWGGKNPRQREFVRKRMIEALDLVRMVDESLPGLCSVIFESTGMEWDARDFWKHVDTMERDGLTGGQVTGRAVGRWNGKVRSLLTTWEAAGCPAPMNKESVKNMASKLSRCGVKIQPTSTAGLPAKPREPHGTVKPLTREVCL